MKAALSILFVLITALCRAQTCVDTSVKAEVYAPGYSLSVRDQLTDAFGNSLLIGVYIQPGGNGLFVIKIKPDGSIAYSNKINFIGTSSLSSPAYTAAMANGNILIATGRGGSGATVPDSIIKLIMLDATGNIIWAKNFGKTGSGVGITSLKQLTSGEIIAAFKYVENQEEQIGYHTGILKIDMAGNILWSKFYSLENEFVYPITAIADKDDDIFFTGSFTDTYLPPAGNYEHNLFAGKINAITGNLVDSKSFFSLKVQDDPNITANFIPLYSSLTLCNSGQLMYTDRFENALRTKNGSIGAILNNDLNFSEASYISVRGFRNNRIRVTKRKEFIIYADSIANNHIESLMVVKTDSMHFPLRQMILNYPLGFNILPPPQRGLGQKENYINLVNSFQVGDDTHLQFYQYPDDVPLTPCYGKDTNLIKFEAFNISQFYHPFFTQTGNLNFLVENFSAITSVLPAIISRQCLIQSSCDFLKINTGIDTICSIRDTFHFSVHKNASCLKHVNWMTDTSAVDFFQNIDDTTIRIRFKKDWSGYVYASINSCSILKDSLLLHVYATPDSLGIRNDTTICPGSSFTVHPKIGYKTYRWENNSTLPDRIINQAGEYSIIAEDYCQNFFYDTIRVKSFVPVVPVHLGQDTVLCQGMQLELHAGTGYKTYQWQDNSTNESFNVTFPGKYFVNAIDSCFNIFRDTITVNYFIQRPPVNLGPDFSFCEGVNNYLLNAGAGYKTYLWGNGTSLSSLNITAPGEYSVIVMDSCGNTSSDTVKVKPPEMIILDINYPFSLCNGESAIINLPANINSYAISGGPFSLQNNKLLLYPATTTFYNIFGRTPANCIVQDTFKINVVSCPQTIYFPDAFTPNGDGLNDIFKAKSSQRLQFFQLSIYNRYGEKIFFTEDINKGWDGLMGGKNQNSGSYIWDCTFTFPGERTRHTTGSFLLLH